MALGFGPPPQVNHLSTLAGALHHPRGIVPATNALQGASFAHLLALPPPSSVPSPPAKPAYLQPWAKANFGQELQKPFWTIDTSVPNLLGLNPVFAGPRNLGLDEFDNDVAFEAMRLRRLVADAELIGDLHERARPYEVINWAIRQFIPVPQALLDLAVARGMPIVGYPSPLDAAKAENRALAAKANKLLSERNSKIAELERDVARQNIEIKALTLRLEESEAQRTKATDQAAEAQPKTNLAGLTRKLNNVSALFYVVLMEKFGIVVGGIKQSDLRGLMAVLRKHGFEPDDETLSGYLLHGSEQAARLAKSPKS